MRYAIVADIHANLPALEAVLEVISTLDVDHIVCLGDLVGYNAQPAEVVDLVRRHVDLVVVGNHDRDVAHARVFPGTHSVAARIAAWTRAQLSEEQLAWLGALPDRIVVPDAFVAVHGCYLSESSHSTGYVTGTTLQMNLEAVAMRSDWPAIALCGHTHLPIAAWLEGARCVEAELRSSVTWPGAAEAILINPGSVGQPRDGDPRASFAVLDVPARTVTLHRIDYDVDAAVAAIEAAGLPGGVAARLRQGR